MFTDLDKNKLQEKFGKLMMRRVIIINILKSYDKEIKAIDKEMDDLMNEYTGEKEDGCELQKVQSV